MHGSRLILQAPVDSGGTQRKEQEQRYGEVQRAAIDDAERQEGQEGGSESERTRVSGRGCSGY